MASSAAAAESLQPQQLDEFVPENFCDVIAYDVSDEQVADAIDEMETKLKDKVKADGVKQQQQDVEDKIKTSCDNVQKNIQETLDRNIDIFDRYVKKNVSVVKGALSDLSAVAPAAGAMDSAARGGRGGGATQSVEATGRTEEVWAFEVNEGTTPKRPEEEMEIDADLARIRKRRREALRRREAMERKGARLATVLQDVNQFVEALQMGVSSSFDDNGLTPVPAKVQEAVESSAELRAIAARAQGLTRRMGELQAQSAAAAVSGGHGDEGGGSQNGSANGAAGGIAARAVAGQGNLQSIFERSRDQQVVAGGVEEYSALQARLNG